LPTYGQKPSDAIYSVLTIFVNITVKMPFQEKIIKRAVDIMFDSSRKETII